MAKRATAEEALDRCIDKLIEDLDWEATLPYDEPARGEVAGLMVVARRLMDLARRSPKADGERRRRLWDRWWPHRDSASTRLAATRQPRGRPALAMQLLV